jgi:hypothetical protein
MATMDTPNTTQTSASSPSPINRHEGSSSTLSEPLLYPVLSSIHASPIPEAEFRKIYLANPDSLIAEVVKALKHMTTQEAELTELKPRLGDALSNNHEKNNAILTITAERDAYKATIASLTAAGAPPNRTPEHPDPTAFSGEDPTLLPIFLEKLELKLRMNHDWWHTEQQRMGYVVTCLTSKAYDQIAYGIVKGVIAFVDVDAILDILKSAFGDTDSAVTAQNRIFDMKQGHKPMSTFLPEWHAVANRTGWDDAAKISHLRRAVHPDILHRLSFRSTSEIPVDIVTYIGLIRQLDNDCRLSNPDYYKSKKPANPTHVLHSPTTTAQLRTTSDGGDAMDLSASSSLGTATTWGKKDVDSGRRPKTEAEREARKAYCNLHKLCNWCNSPDHQSYICPTAPWNTGKGKA